MRPRIITHTTAFVTKLRQSRGLRRDGKAPGSVWELTEVRVRVLFARREKEGVGEHAVDEMVGSVQACPFEGSGRNVPVVVGAGHPTFEHEIAQHSKILD